MPSPFPGIDRYLGASGAARASRVGRSDGEGGQSELTAVIDCVPQADTHVPKPRVSVRKLMMWVGVIAVLLGLGRYPYTFIQTQRRFMARFQEGDGLVQSYYVQCPASTSPASWREAVTGVQIAWDNVVFSPASIAEGSSIISSGGFVWPVVAGWGSLDSASEARPRPRQPSLH